MGQPGKLDEAVQTVQESIVPVMKQQTGFKGYLLLADPNTNKSLSITIWDTEADMTTGEGSGYYREQIAKVASLLAGPPTMEHFEVRVQL
jgi:heme-degrading monooxygenase HmoA